MRINRLHRIKAAQKEFKLPVSKFEAIDITKSKKVPNGMTRAFRNNRFIVMVYDDKPIAIGSDIKATCALIQKHDDTPITHHWRSIQAIKNELFGEETTAVEYYPAESRLIDAHNIYWIWIFPNGELPIPQ